MVVGIINNITYAAGYPGPAADLGSTLQSLQLNKAMPAHAEN